jgi:glycosyltransferase involved in cell wall biosynthesis
MRCSAEKKHFLRQRLSDNEMKHYVFLTNVPQGYGWGGCEQQMLDYFRRADLRNTKITVAVTRDVFTSKIEQAGLAVKVVFYPFQFNAGSIKRFFRMRSFLKRLSADGVIVVQNDFLKFKLSEFAAAYLAAKGNVYSLEVLGASEPVRPAARMHFKVIPGLAFRWRLGQIALMLRERLCRRVLAASEEVKERMVKWYHYRAGNIEVVFKDIDSDKYRPDSLARENMRSRYGIGKTDVVIISTARFCGQKRLDRLINAFDEVCRGRDNFWLFMVGDGPLRAYLEDLAGRKSMRDRIKFVGHQEDVAVFLQMSDIYVLPSELEGLGIALLEAMAAGLVAVATKTPGPNEIINDSVNGFLVERDEQAVADGLRKALRLSESERVEMTSAARQLVQKKFGVENCTLRALQIMGIDCVTVKTDRYSVASPSRAVPQVR